MLDLLIYLLIAVAAFFVFMQGFVWISGFLKKGKRISAVKGELGRKISSGQKLMVYFYSPGCAACKPMTPVVNNMKKEFRDIFPVNLARDMETARAFGVMGTPATVIVEKGQIQKFVLGARSEKYLRGLIAPVS